MGLDRAVGRYRLRRIFNEAGELVFDADSREIVEPLPRLRTEGRPNPNPSLRDVLLALFRRLHLLRAVYHGFQDGPEWRTPLLQQAERAWWRADWRPFDWSR